MDILIIMEYVNLVGLDAKLVQIINKLVVFHAIQDYIFI